MRIDAPAKINLFLRVAAVGTDGYHPIQSWMCRIGLHDEMVFETGGRNGLELLCDQPDLDCGPTNLIRRAADLLMSHAMAKSSPHDVRIRLTKRIPIGAGLGGGSSNAACALAGLNQFWKLNLPQEELIRLAARLGSDVPFFLGQGSALCTGRGEILTPMKRPQAKGCVLILPPYALSTAAVYRQFDRLPVIQPLQCAPADLIANWHALPARGLMQFLFNDLEPAAFALRPELAQLREAIENSVGRTLRMSGSGSSLFTLTDSLDEAQILATRITQHHGVTSMGVSLCPDDATEATMRE